MRKGDIANLQMRKMLGVGKQTEDIYYKCTVLKYDEKKECIYFLLESDSLAVISLDAVYGCEIQTEKEMVSCMGRIRERYCGPQGKILKFQIKNGFYKINLKCVDKQRA